MKWRTNFGILLLGLIGFSGLIICNTQHIRNLHTIDNMLIHQKPNEILRMNCRISSYTESDPIVISGNNGFVNYGFPGNGSSNAPYIIENLQISNSTTHLIDIKNTDAYFIIQNNLLNGYDGSMASINLYFVSNGVIQNNSFNSGNYGLWLDRSSKNTIANNTITNYEINGIHFQQCDECLFYNNTIERNGEYAIVGSGTANRFIGNVIKNNQNGMEVWLQSSNISGNIISNTIDTAEPCMRLAGEGGNIIMNNIVFNNSGLALSVEASQYQYASNMIMKNDFISNRLAKDSQALDVTLSDQPYTGESPSFSHNYWYDWLYPDNNSDGVVDFPYPIPTFEGELNYDQYPLTSPCNPYSSSLHFLSCPRIIRPVINDILDGNIYVEWYQATDISSSLIHYTIYYSFNGSQWIEIQDKLIETQFTWDAGDLTNGEYKLRIVADCPESELNSEYYMHKAFLIKNPDLTSGFDLLIILLSFPFLTLLWKKKEKIIL